MKKHLAILLAAAMSTTLFAGCGGASQPAASSQGTAASAPQSSASAAPADGTAATDGEILFGLSCALTGNFPLAGQRTREGIDLALE